MADNLYIEDYTAKSFVVRGETKNHKETLKKLGGKWNSGLTDKKTQEKFGAWLFWSDKKVEITNWIKTGCPSDVPEEIPRTPIPVYNSRPSTSASNDEVLRRMERDISELKGMVRLLLLKSEDKNPVSSSLGNNSGSDVDVEEEEDEDVLNIPPKRLIK